MANSVLSYPRDYVPLEPPSARPTKFGRGNGRGQRRQRCASANRGAVQAMTELCMRVHLVRRHVLLTYYYVHRYVLRLKRHRQAACDIFEPLPQTAKRRPVDMDMTLAATA